MLNKTLFTLTTALLAITVSVTANPIPNSEGVCNTGPVQCCETRFSAQSREANLLTSLLGLDLGGILGDIASGCSPLSVVGVGGGTRCSSAPVCCTDNKFNGLINVGCVPVTVGL
ncbi:hypothetical protein CC1G_05739 [Coprinopsis cinerea okayama7|uniref:Hydrophobin n=1 Tax=Coprinopsis cinerea (strain Okayama-7 / 130 / ATCC MYA-4618 / FGSC 9003) TaxID=240176 RepID=A8NA12_COPC7|nr:hypothetical protein CC1G_05739 [Coprinopsis cinerea okayama7\|eukprot:XP_001831668.1 hypothetical protein CC1G_05739 [Coprinopsis cinerea okayama7\